MCRLSVVVGPNVVRVQWAEANREKLNGVGTFNSDEVHHDEIALRSAAADRLDPTVGSGLIACRSLTAPI
jgi:hypothetical protein